MCRPFAVIQQAADEDDEDEDDSEADASGDDEPEPTAAELLAEEKAALDLPARAKFKREHPVWKTLLRSKGESGPEDCLKVAIADPLLVFRLLLAGN